METKKQKIASLWKTCFGDTDEFIQFYFDHKYSDENALLHEENGQPLAALQMLPYPMTWDGTTICASYISGACTLPEARNKGVMSRLLGEAFHTMYQRELDLSFLIPAETWLYGYYQKTGYVPVFEHTLETFTPGTPATTVADLSIPAVYSDTLTNKFYPYFNREMQKRSCCIQHTPDDFTTVLQELYANGGKLLVATTNTDSSRIVGLAFAVPADNSIRITELLSDSPEIRTQLLYAASRQWDKRTVICKLPAQAGKSEKGGMARIIGAQNMLTRFAARHPGISFDLQLADPLLPDNNGYYSIAAGHCIKSKKQEENTCLHLDISMLTQALLGGLPGFPAFPNHHPYMSLMLD